jgi:hypothetical protein
MIRSLFKLPRFKYSPFSLVVASFVVTIANTCPVVAQVAVRIPDRDVEVWEIVNLDGQIWLGTAQGAYRIEGDTAKRIPDLDSAIHDIVNLDGQIWLGTAQGAYRIEGDTAKRIPDLDSAIHDIVKLDGQIWLGTSQGAYRVEGDTAKPIPNLDVEVYDIVKLDGQIWLGTSQGAYRVEGDTAKPIPDLVLPVWEIVKLDGQIWLGTARGAYRLEGDTAKPISNLDVKVYGRVKVLSVGKIVKLDGQIWLGTAQGAYRVEGDTAKPIPDLDLGRTLYDIVNLDGQIWLRTNRGAYRLDEDAVIGVDLVSTGPGWKFLDSILPWKFYVSPIKPEICYTRKDYSCADGKAPYDKSFPRKFESIIVVNDKDKFDELVQAKDYFSYLKQETVPNGINTVYISVRDQWGNTFNYERKIWVAGPGFIAFLGGVFWFGVLIIVIFLAPYNTFCNGLLMNPWFRTIGSFGLVPIALTTVPPIRSHILRRYRREIRQDDNFSQWLKRFVVPSVDFLPEIFGKLLNQRRVLFLQGQSGLGKTVYFRYLTCLYAAPEKGLLPKNVIPVFLTLSRYQDTDLETAFQIQLENYGRLQDKALTTWFLKQGGFVIFLDGLNEVNVATRDQVNRFVESYWKANYFCTSSQELYPNFNWMKTVELAALGRDEIKILLQRQLGKDKAETIMQQLTPESESIYSIPQNLEFAIKVVQQNQPLPQSLRELYKVTLAPVSDEWKEKGRNDFPELLFEKSYQMLCSHNPFFEKSEPDVPEELQNTLLTQKLLIRRGDHYYFQHDLIRAFLASEYFTPRWRELIAKNEVTIDENWRSLLELALCELTNPEEAKDLLFIVLDKNLQLAGKLFNYLKTNSPQLCASWANDFTRKFGEQNLNQLPEK